MGRQLFRQAMIKFFGGLLLVGALIFLPAGTLRFWKGWLLMGVLFVPMFIAGILMWLIGLVIDNMIVTMIIMAILIAVFIVIKLACGAVIYRELSKRIG